MGFSFSTESGDGVQVSFTFAFVGYEPGYIRESDVRVFVRDSDPASPTYNESTELIETYAFPSPNVVTVQTVIGAPLDASPNIIIRRIMPKEEIYADIDSDAVFRKKSLNNSFIQMLYTQHEVLDGFIGVDESLPSLIVDLYTRVSRTLRVVPEDPIDEDDLLIPLSRANKYISFDGDGKLILTDGTIDILPQLDDALVNDLSQAYEFATQALMSASVIVFPLEKILRTKEHTFGNDTGGATYIVTSGVSPNIGSPSLTTGKYARLRPNPNNTIDMYGANTGQNSSTAINVALSEHVGRVKMESSDYILDAQLDVASGPCTGIKGNGLIDSRMTKAFNGDAIIINNQGTVLSDFWIQGDGVNFTGGGVYIQSDGFKASQLRCTDTEDSCIIFKAGSSTFGKVKDCFLLTTDKLIDFAIRGDGIDASPSPSSRVFDLIEGGGALVDFTGMNRAILSNSFGTKVKFTSTADKITMDNNRITSATSNITVLGNSHIITDNTWGFGTGFNLIFDASISHVKYDNANINSVDGNANAVVVNNAPTGDEGTTNSIFQELVNFATEWKGLSLDGILGDSAVNSTYSVADRQCSFTLDFTKGSTSVVPSGVWFWTLPFKALSTASCNVMVTSSSGTSFSATGIVQGGSNLMTTTLNASDGAMDETDLLFGTGAQFLFTMQYEMASA